jgi:hypothetical protein
MAKKIKEPFKGILTYTEKVYSILLVKNFPDHKIFMMGIFAFFIFISLSGALFLSLFISKQKIKTPGVVTAVSKSNKMVTIEFINPETKEKRSFRESYLIAKPRVGKKVTVSFNPQNANEQPSVQIRPFYYFLIILLSGISSLVIWPSQLKLIYKNKSVVSKN